MGFAEKNIKTPADIKGKTIVLTPGDSMSQVWPLVMKKTAWRTATSRSSRATRRRR